MNTYEALEYQRVHNGQSSIGNSDDQNLVHPSRAQTELETMPEYDVYADSRPRHDANHWITNWIRSKMETPAERYEKLNTHLTRIQERAHEM